MTYQKVILVGRLGRDPEIKRFNGGDKVANLRLATSERWRDKQSGERKEKVEWHSVAVFGDGLVGVCEQYLRKGSQIMVEGQIQTRSWEKDGEKRYTTEIIVRGFSAKLVMLDTRSDGDGSEREEERPARKGEPQQSQSRYDDLDDDIPF
jgi:single-strand DNA-binding protein